MSHTTTSWKSHTRAWRWTAGKDGRTPEGGKARRVGGRPPLAGEKAIRKHGKGEVPPAHAVRTCGSLYLLVNMKERDDAAIADSI
jgi:hypothetical protein